MKFAETVAVNRGLPVRLFSSVNDAEKWLLGEECEGTPIGRFARSNSLTAVIELN